MPSKTAKPEARDVKENKGHAKAKAQRAMLEARLREEGADDLADKLKGCGMTLVLECSCCHLRKEVEVRCERRWCPVCARKIAAERVARYTFAVARMEWPLFVTLTVANQVEAWEGIKKLKASWGKMRRTKWFKRCQVVGGITAIEITNRGKGWHPHLHSIIDCRWLAVATPRPQRGDTKAVIKAKCKAAKAELDHEWAKCCQQLTASTYVKRSDRLNLREVLKYCADPGTLLNEHGVISELIRAIDKFRMVQPFGSCMGISAMIRELAESEMQPKPCAYCEANSWRPAMTIERPAKGYTYSPRAPDKPWMPGDL